MTTPTPGPWINDNGLVTGRCTEFAGAPSFDIFDAANWPGHEDEGQANARLIAAAPEMLEMLKNIAAGRYDGAPDTARMRARSIVAKATGGTEAAR
jgi:hypothetical protein